MSTMAITMRSLFVLFTFTLLVQTAAALSGPAKPHGLTVPTAQGPVRGTFAPHTNKSVRQFLGIPFGSVPNGRWTAPQLPAVRKGRDPLAATSFGMSCVQQLDARNNAFLDLLGGAMLDVIEGEDCLSLNIWAPAVGRKQNTAVLVWIHGGGFVFGTSNITTYDGTSFVQNHDDLTLVTINYRLNIFGQPNAPQLHTNSSNPQPQNFGLLDIDAAIQWVHDNIATFGGDPNRISLVGESAGAAAADLYTISHPKDTIVKGVIMQSATFAIVSLLAPTPIDPTGWNAVAKAVGCGTTPDVAQFECMQSIPFRKLKNAVISTNSSFAPVTDGVTVFADATTRFSQGNFLRVPMLVGSTQHEQDIFVVVQEILTLGFTLPGITQILSDALTLTTFTCPAGAAAAARVQFGVPTWRYRYDGVFPNMSPRDDLRAYHFSEVPLVFGTLDSISATPPPTPAERALSTIMQQIWATFAQNPQSGLVDTLGLPLYNPRTVSLIQFGAPSNQGGVSFTSGALVDAACGNLDVVNEIIKLAGNLLT